VMVNATNVCSDKTATLNQNKMAVVAGMVESKADFSDLLRLAVVIGALPPTSFIQ
jgi:magnesium-transporting ATPase (P-type)